MLNPATEEAIGTVGDADRADLDEALEAAAKGFKIGARWRRSTAPRSCAKRQRSCASEPTTIGPLLTLEQGKTLAEAEDGGHGGRRHHRLVCRRGQRAYGRMILRAPLRHLPARDQRAGRSVAAFTPRNFPINQVVRKLSAGLAAGCSIIVKAPEETPAHQRTDPRLRRRRCARWRGTEPGLPGTRPEFRTI